MGYSNSGSIREFWPDDTDTEIFISDFDSPTLQDIIDRSKEKWGDIDFNNISIDPDNIHTHCLGYDGHDSGDYTNFIRITYRKTI